MGEAAGNPGKLVDADLDFHRALLGATHNQLVLQMERVIASGLAMRDQVVHNADPADDPVPSHRKVLDAIGSATPRPRSRPCGPGGQGQRGPAPHLRAVITSRGW